MYLIPLVRTSRAIAASTILPNHPFIAITTSETISYIIPFINNSPLNAINHMILFLFYYISYNESALAVMEQFKNKYKREYILEFISILTYLFIYFYNI